MRPQGSLFPKQLKIYIIKKEAGSCERAQEKNQQYQSRELIEEQMIVHTRTQPTEGWREDPKGSIKLYGHALVY